MNMHAEKGKIFDLKEKDLEKPAPKTETKEYKPRKSYSEVAAESKKTGSDRADRFFDYINSTKLVRATKWLGVGYLNTKNTISSIAGRSYDAGKDMWATIFRGKVPSDKQKQAINESRAINEAIKTPTDNADATSKVRETLLGGNDKLNGVMQRAVKALADFEEHIARIEAKVEEQKRRQEEKDARIAKLEIHLKQLMNLRKSYAKYREANNLSLYKHRYQGIKKAIGREMEELNKAA